MKRGVCPAYGVAPVETAEYVSGFARLEEELGFESIWAAEHVVMPAHYESRYPYTDSGRKPDVYQGGYCRIRSCGSPGPRRRRELSVSVPVS